jgi:hypothetical protein
VTGPGPGELPMAEKIVAIDHALSAARLPHAFGGALALAYYAEPRATFDVDVNVFVPLERWAEVAKVLEGVGVDCTTDARVLERDGWVRWHWGRTPVDVFFAYDAIHEAMRQAVRVYPFGADRLPFIGPEHLAVCKMAFDRRKDWLDVEGMLAASEGLDTAEIRRWLDHLVGADDQRRRRFDELAALILGE